MAGGVLLLSLPGLVGLHVHVDISIVMFALWSVAKSLVTMLDTIKQRAPLLRAILLKSWVDCRGHESRHELCHHSCLLLQKRHKLHLILGVHVHHRVVLHAHTAHLSSMHSAAILVKTWTLHMVSPVRAYPPAALLTANTM